MKRTWLGAAATAVTLIAAAGLVLHQARQDHSAEAQATATEAPNPIPGAATITVKARDADGSRPVGARCFISWANSSQPQPLPQGSFGSPVQQPTVVGADGDWTIHNVPRETWDVSVVAEGFTYLHGVNTRTVDVSGHHHYTVTFLLLRGGTVKGRVVEADTGRPVAGAIVGEPYYEATTDANGRYSIAHVAPGIMRVQVQSDRLVWGNSEPFEVRDEEVSSVPDVRLHRGGWIVGRVVLPEEEPDGFGGWARGGVMPSMEEGERPKGTYWQSRDTADHGSFRLGPLPPGVYSVEAWVSPGKDKAINPKKLRRFTGEVKRVRVAVGKETRADVPVTARGNATGP